MQHYSQTLEAGQGNQRYLDFVSGQNECKARKIEDWAIEVGCF